MVKVIEVEYKIDVKSEILSRKADIVEASGLFWEHAIIDGSFDYRLPIGDIAKAKAVGSILKILMGKGKSVKKVRQRVFVEGE